MNTPWSLQGKKVLVTGATKGIGKAIVEECLKLGAEVMLVARTQADIEKAVEEYRAAGHSAMGIAADIATAEGRNILASYLSQQWNALDVLINNAGINIRKPTMEYPEADFQQIMATNMQSAWELCRLCYPYLKEAKGNIVNIGSVASHRALRTSTAAYAMSKAAVEGMTRFLACEWAAVGIRVNAILPWYTRTPLASHVLQDQAKYQNIVSRTPLGRIAEPEEVARGVIFLAMPAASFITGVSLPVDGGYLVLGL